MDPLQSVGLGLGSFRAKSLCMKNGVEGTLTFIDIALAQVRNAVSLEQWSHRAILSVLIAVAFVIYSERNLAAALRKQGKRRFSTVLTPKRPKFRPAPDL